MPDSNLTPLTPEPEAPPYVLPPPVGPQALMVPLGWGAPWQWLQRGAADLRAHPGIGLFYGGCFWLMAFTLGAVFRSMPEYTMSMASGCLLLGPFLAMGLYEVSRRHEQAVVPDLRSSLICWSPHLRRYHWQHW